MVQSCGGNEELLGYVGYMNPLTFVKSATPTRAHVTEM